MKASVESDDFDDGSDNEPSFRTLHILGGGSVRFSTATEGVYTAWDLELGLK